MGDASFNEGEDMIFSTLGLSKDEAQTLID